jgi:hypothetical protein
LKLAETISTNSFRLSRSPRHSYRRAIVGNTSAASRVHVCSSAFKRAGSCDALGHGGERSFDRGARFPRRSTCPQNVGAKSLPSALPPRIVNPRPYPPTHPRPPTALARTVCAVKMFFHITQEKNVILEPRHFGKNLQEVLREKLKNEVRVDQGQTHAFPG